MRSRVPVSQRVVLNVAVKVFTTALTCGSRISEAQTQAKFTAIADVAALGDPRTDAFSFDARKNERRTVDLHQHIEAAPERFQRAIGILDRAGVGIGVILGAGTVTAKDGQPSDFKKQRQWQTRCIAVVSCIR